MVLKVLPQTYRIFVRFKNPKNHWSVVRKKSHPVDKALAHFDDFYKDVFAKKWPSIREGLLFKQKYVAVINNFGDSEEAMKRLEQIGALNMRKLFEIQKQNSTETQKERKRQKALKEIFQMDEVLSKKVDNELKQDENVNKSNLSLESSLQNAEIDDRRFVNPENSLSAEILREFVPATKIKGKSDFITESEHYRYYETEGAHKITVENEYDLHFPEHLNIYCFEEDNFSTFEPSPISSTGVLNYYLMDGGSILPVLALDLKPNDHFLDLCAAPGGKSLLALQTLYPAAIVSNDVSISRTNRIHKVFHQFLYDFQQRWLETGKIKITSCDGRHMFDDDFDKILVDVPCTTDRHSLQENDNNIFKPSRVKERLKLPELQSELLFSALKLVKRNGVVVYSTCSLSPIQNDGVVHMALRRAWEETRAQFVVKDLRPALMRSKFVYRMADRNLTKYGSLVLPHRPQNYGPTYFCKLVRIK